ncbi:chloride-transporting ATPase activity protein [Halocaridina rubra]|uniref:Chloride-transporting ATPase activity protein n=1 Tax=Halocaridina rubra TaxID=373956 RepID=A0AAN8ZYE7_HALRR
MCGIFLKIRHFVHTATLLEFVSTFSFKQSIIGGGIAGTSAAFFLKELFGDDAIMDLYESEAIGGRLATIPISGNVYEVGGSIIHPRNEYMIQFASKFGKNLGNLK